MICHKTQLINQEKWVIEITQAAKTLAMVDFAETWIFLQSIWDLLCINPSDLPIIYKTECFAVYDLTHSNSEISEMRIFSEILIKDEMQDIL